MKTPGAVTVRIVRARSGRRSRVVEDLVAAEEPLEIRVRTRGIAITMRTPGQDEELAAGFLLSEGVIRDRADLVTTGPCRQSPTPENVLNVFLAPRVRVRFSRLTRHVFATSSCGLCGKATIEAVRQHFPPVDSPVRLPARTLIGMPAKMRRAQADFGATGGLHAAAIFDRRGRLLAAREDVGRHNAVDKVIGSCFLAEQYPLEDRVLLVSGRASFEIMQKALAARIPIVAAISAPSSLAVEFARESGQTLIGFLRGPTMNLYAHPERITA